MHEVLVNRLGGLSLPRKSVVRLTVRPDMTLDVYRGRKKQPTKKDKTSLSFCAIVGQGPTVLAVGAGGVVWTFFLSPIISLFFLPHSGRRHDID